MDIGKRHLLGQGAESTGHPSCNVWGEPTMCPHGYCRERIVGALKNRGVSKVRKVYFKKDEEVKKVKKVKPGW